MGIIKSISNEVRWWVDLFADKPNIKCKHEQVKWCWIAQGVCLVYCEKCKWEKTCSHPKEYFDKKNDKKEI